MKLQDGERIILKSPIGWRNKAILTNKRLIFAKEKGWFKKESFIEQQIALNDIVMVDTETSGFTTLTKIHLHLKNGAIKTFMIKLSDSDMGLSMGDSTRISTKQNMETLRFVNALSQLIKPKS